MIRDAERHDEQGWRDLWAQYLAFYDVTLTPVDYRVTLRYTDTITRAMRVLFGSLVLDIVAEPINVNSAGRTLELMCVSGLRDG